MLCVDGWLFKIEAYLFHQTCYYAHSSRRQFQHYTARPLSPPLNYLPDKWQVHHLHQDRDKSDMTLSLSSAPPGNKPWDWMWTTRLAKGNMFELWPGQASLQLLHISWVTVEIHTSGHAPANLCPRGSQDCLLSCGSSNSSLKFHCVLEQAWWALLAACMHAATDKHSSLWLSHLLFRLSLCHPL